MKLNEQTNERVDRRSFMGRGAGLGAAALATLTTAHRARAAENTLSHVIDVIDEGADPTGRVNSYPAIQAAIDKAVRLKGEAAVLFPTGKYVITDTLTIAGPDESRTVNNISLIGMRASIELISPGVDIVRFTNTSHCMIKDLYLTATLGSGHGIALTNSHRTIMDNVEIYQVGGNCLYADKAFYLSAFDCIFSRPGANHYAVRHLSAMNNVCYFHCRFAGATSLDRGGLFTASAKGAISRESSAGITIIACDFSMCKIGLKLQAGANLYVANSYFEANEVGVQWGEVENAIDPVTGEQIDALGWPMCGTIDNCTFTSKLAQPVVFIDLKRGTNLRINNPFFDGNGTDTIGIRVARLPTDPDLRGLLQRVVLDDVPYAQGVTTVVSDPNEEFKRVRKPALMAY